MGSIGFCTAPRRESAPTSTIDSNHVGSSHETLTSSPTPSSMSPAATRSTAALYSANVRLRPSSSSPKRASGVAAARRSTSSHSVRPSRLVLTPPPVSWAALPERRCSWDALPERPCQLSLVGLEHQGQRQVVDERHLVGHLVVGQAGTHPRAQLVGGGRRIRRAHHPRRTHLPEHRVGYPDDRRPRHAWMLGQHVLDLRGVDVVAAAYVHLALAAHEREVTAVVERPEVAQRQPTVGS